jgi:hypothetical protein
MQVDEAGHDDEATDVLNLGAIEFRADSSDPPTLEADIHHRVDTLRRIDNSAPSQNEIKLHKNHLSAMESARLSLKLPARSSAPSMTVGVKKPPS